MQIPQKVGGFRYSFAGIRLAWRQANFRFHAASALVALALSWLFHISLTELALVVFAIGFVFTTEVFNTALEEFCDHVTPEEHVNIAKVKDLAAAAVLISSCTAFLVGCIVFIPRLITFL